MEEASKADAPARTHRSALVIVPPRRIWGPIQAIRLSHDRQVGRWMPHVTLVYPFRPCAEFARAAAAVGRAARSADPFDVTLARFGFFEHGLSFTLWLDPEPNEPLVRLQRALVSEFPDCDDVNRFEGGFRPHLSVGQARDRRELDGLLDELTPSWEPLTFTVQEVAMIRRGPETGEVFRLDRGVRLGRP
jgi:2'-5' RNA ligase